MHNFDRYVDIAERKARGCQPWPKYFRLRAKELESLFSLYTPRPGKRALDIGSGIGFTTFILRSLYERTCAMDLYAHDIKTHSLGISRAQDFLNSVGSDGIDVVSSSCEELPFLDGSFDAVYMFYTLEHIPNRIEALKEVKRVLAKGGRAVIVVPCFFEKLLYPLSFYRDLARGAVRHIRAAKPARASRDQGSQAPEQDQRSLVDRMHSGYPHFPFPEPHGEYSNYFTELVQSTVISWEQIIKASGLPVRDVFTTMLLPKEFLSLFLGDGSLDLYIRTIGINKKFGRNAFLRHFGQNVCFILGE